MESLKGELHVSCGRVLSFLLLFSSNLSNKEFYRNRDTSIAAETSIIRIPESCQSKNSQ